MMNLDFTFQTATVILIGFLFFVLLFDIVLANACAIFLKYHKHLSLYKFNKLININKFDHKN